MRVKGQVFGMMKGCRAGRAVITVIAHQASARAGIGPASTLLGRIETGILASKKRDDAGLGIDAADVIGPFTGQIEMAGVVHGHAARGVKLGFQRRTAIPAAPHPARTSHTRNDAGTAIDAPDHLIAQVGQIEIALFVLG